MTIRLQQRQGTASAWTSANPTLALGEIGYESDTNKFKIGTGSTAWTSLAYAAVPQDTSGNVVIAGNLTVNGTTETINSTTLTVADKNIEIGTTGSPTNITADGGGITLKGATDKTIIWDSTNTNWTSSEHWNLASGKSFKINNVALNAVSETLTNKTLTSPVIGTIVNTGTLTLPTSTDTLVGRATTDTLTNKTFDTAGTGNVFKINGTQVSTYTGSGSVVLQTAPTFSTPTISNSTTTAASGLIDYNGDTFFVTTNANTSGKGAVVAPQWVVATTNSSAATTTTPVTPFAAANDTLTLDANKLYYFKGTYYATSTFTSGTAAIQLGFTFSNAQQAIKYKFKTFNQTAGAFSTTADWAGVVSAATATTVSPNITTTGSYAIEFEGYFTSNATTGGTILPFFQMSTTGSSTVMTQFSDFTIQKVGASTAAVIAGAWA